LLALNRQGHEVDVFGIGTHLVTCQKQPALGCVYKLVEINGTARIKLSQEMEKMIIPGKKDIYRIYGTEDHSLVDILQLSTEGPPEIGQRILVRHPFEESKRAYVTPVRVEKLLSLVFDCGKVILPLGGSLENARNHCKEQLSKMRSDHTRETNPAPYKISLSDTLYQYSKQVWLSELPVAELK
jgi:nicotinate phosphoribosyltransferase